MKGFRLAAYRELTEEELAATGKVNRVNKMFN